MVSIITIILFFLYTWGLGFTVTYFVKQSENTLERHLMNIGIGLGVFAILSIILNFFRVPLDWKIFLVLSLIIPVYDLIKKYKNKQLSFPNFKLTKSNLAILIVLLIFLTSFYIYTKGAFSYPYLEDEDPWGHAIGVKYVALEKDAYDPPLIGEDLQGQDLVLSYIDPYPPAYDVFLGILHQTSPDLTWTMKFFNALIISLGFIFFFFFAWQFIGNRNKALFATFILAAIPCYLSHFIWAHSLVVTLFFPTMYAFEMIKKDRKWMFVALILVAAIWVSQNLSQPIKITMMILLYLIVISIVQKKFFTKGFIALFGGMILSQVWWGAMVKKYTLKGFIRIWQGNLLDSGGTSSSTLISLSNKLISVLQSIVNPGGSGSRAYLFNDFFIAKSQNMINNPIGVGIVISLLVLIGFIFVIWKHKSAIVKSKQTWVIVTLFWLIFTFWGVNGQTFPISVARGPFRIWMLMAIPIALISVEGLYFVKALFKQKHLKILVVILVVTGIIFTSAQQKYEHNTSIWPTSGSYSGAHQSEPFEYGLWFNSIPDTTSVFTYSPRDKLTIGYGKYSCAWCQNILDFRENILHENAEELHQFLKENQYQFLIINARMENKYFKGIFGEEETNKLLQVRYNEIINSELFIPVYQKENMFVVFEVK